MEKNAIFFPGCSNYLDRAVNLKVGCIYKTFGDKKIKFRCKLKFFGGILKKQRVTKVE